jgi:translation elongation factor EF-Tu-like GTPase
MFDTAQMRTIFVDHTDLASAASCREQIVIQLREALGDNAVVNSPIATNIDVRALASGDKVEQNTAELVTAVEELSKMQRLSLGRMDPFEAMIEDLAMRSFDNLDMRTFTTWPKLIL